MKRTGILFLTIVMVISMAGCLRDKGIIGTWEYDIAEEADPDMEGVILEIEEDMLHLINKSGETIDAKYEKNDEMLYITEMSFNGERAENEEFMELPYALMDEKLMIDWGDGMMGKMFFNRVD